MVAIAVDYEQAFKNAGIDMSKLKAAGLDVKLNTSGIKFVLDGEALASLPIPPGKVSELATKYDPSNQTHQTMKASITSVVAQLEKKLAGGEPIKAPLGAAPIPAPPLPAQALMSEHIKTFPKDKMNTAPLVQLAQAESLFQPVKGTSAGSRYFVVGLGAGIKVAARYKKGGGSGGKLSVRIEGASFSKLTAKIQEAGVFGPAFAGSFEGNYASMHLSVDGKKEAQRVIGAVLGSMAPYIGHATPDLQPLVDVAA